MSFDNVFRPKRCDLVVYNGTVWYFEPNGTSCYLYDKPYSVGIHNCAIHCPARWKVTRPTQSQIDSQKIVEIQLANQLQDSRDTVYQKLCEKVYIVDIESNSSSISDSESSSISDSESSFEFDISGPG